MKTPSLFHFVVITGLTFAGAKLFAQESTPPFSTEEREQVYSATIAKRATAAVELLAITDTAKSNKVHGVIISQYRALRARDEALDNMFRALSKDAPGAETNRAVVLPVLSRQLHQQFIAKLGDELTQIQVEQIKDKMTYNKLKVTFDAYCAIIPNLSNSDKTQVMELLKAAREEAMDGGSADEKSAIFQRYKEQVNAYLGRHGHDVAKATREWEAKQASAAPAEGAPKPAN